MEWVGFIALMILICYSSYPDKVKRLEAKVKKLEPLCHCSRSILYSSSPPQKIGSKSMPSFLNATMRFSSS